MGAKISKRYFSHTFNSISTKLYDKYDSHGGIQAITFLALCQKLKILWHFEIFNTTILGWKFQNATLPTLFIQYQPNFMRTLATMVECRLLLFLAIGQVLNILWIFEILAWDKT